jgi:hypothetical protein
MTSTQFAFLSHLGFLKDVAEICYLRLNLVLVAMEARKYEGGRIWINPHETKVAAALFYTAMFPAGQCQFYWALHH